MRALACAVAVTVAACAGAPDGDGEPPAGFVRYEVQGGSFLYPQAWVVAQDTGAVVRIFSEEDGAETDPAIVFERTEGLPTAMDFGAHVGLFSFEADAALPGREVLSEQDVDVFGAADARLIEVRYPWGDDGEVVHQHDLLALHPDGTVMHLLRVSAAQGALDSATRMQVMESLRFTESR